MANYSDIKGFTVQTLSTDTIASQAAGGAWASGGALNTGRNGLRGAGISQTATVVFGGNDGSVTGKTENYNGSSWTETTDLNTGKTNAVGTGTYTAAIAAYTSTAETWDGSSWSEVSEMNTSRQEVGSLGTSTAALAIGNQNAASAIVEQWDGSSWTEVGDLTTAVGVTSGFGTTSAGNAAGGATSPGASVANNQSWNGSAWTEVGDLNQNRYFGSASGTSTSGLVFAGYRSSPASEIANTEAWNGTSFTEQADLSTARFTGGPAHNSTQADSLLAGGNPSNKTNTEEWSAPSDFVQQVEGQLFFNSTTNTFKETVKDIPGATWASSGALNSPRGNAGTSGIQTAALFFGGDGPPGTIAITELYNGSSWTEVGDLNVARSQTFFSNQGTSTAALNATGSPIATNVESWNGSSWTETTDLNTARRNGASLGTQGAMLGTGGYNPPSYRTLTEIWDGSSWTETGDCPDAKFIGQGGGGTTTAGIIAGNYPNGDVDSSQTWDGTTWTNGPNINTGRSGIAFSATSQSSALAHGGGVGTPQAASKLTEFFDGTSWTELNDMAQVSQSGGGAGSSILGIHYGGYGPGALTTTEEWTVGLGNKTITAS